MRRHPPALSRLRPRTGRPVRCGPLGRKHAGSLPAWLPGPERPLRPRGAARATQRQGAHCCAGLPAGPLDDAQLVRRHAVYGHRWVYVFEPDPTSSDGLSGTLGRREVPLLRSLGDYVLVDYAGRTGTEHCELQAGEFVILSPLTRPVVGMKITMRSESLAAVPSLPVVRTPIRDFEKIKRDATLTFRLLDVVRRGG